MSTAAGRRDVAAWSGVIVAAAALTVVLWVCVSSWDALLHANPTYPVLLAVTIVVAALALWLNLRHRDRRRGWRLAGRFVLVILGAGWLAIIGWLRPYPALEPALAAMHSTAGVRVTETPTQIELLPNDTRDTVGVFFQPGALVDARAYAAVLRPLAAQGHPVIIAKQPLGIAFLALGAFDTARKSQPEVSGWVVAGHSLGGTVAAIQAQNAQHDRTSPACGLLFYASYPASDLSSSLTLPVESVSGTRDGLATPQKIQASRKDLPADTHFTVIAGASHAQFGSYGAQPGDNTPSISNERARQLIAAASGHFVNGLSDATRER